jgi:hypothetical protein
MSDGFTRPRLLRTADKIHRMRMCICSGIYCFAALMVQSQQTPSVPNSTTQQSWSGGAIGRRRVDAVVAQKKCNFYLFYLGWLPPALDATTCMEEGTSVRTRGCKPIRTHAHSSYVIVCWNRRAAPVVPRKRSESRPLLHYRYLNCLPQKSCPRSPRRQLRACRVWS